MINEDYEALAIIISKRVDIPRLEFFMNDETCDEYNLDVCRDYGQAAEYKLLTQEEFELLVRKMKEVLKDE